MYGLNNRAFKAPRDLLLAGGIWILAIANACSALNLEAQEAAQPNFVIILTDDQSWVGTSVEMVPGQSVTRSTFFETPNIERLAETGLRFSRGYSPAPFCCPTRRSLVIGQTPARHIYQKDQTGWSKRFRAQLSIPRVLKAANPKYQTAHFGKWDSRFDQVTPEEMGYDISDGLTGNATGGGKGSGGPAPSKDPKSIFDLTRRTCEFIEHQSKSGNPFFVQISHYAVHLDIFYRRSTYEKAAARVKDRRHTVPEFAAMTNDMDTGIGMLIDRITSLGLRDNTYIFFLSDNGGREKIPGDQNSQPRNHPLRDGKGSMYEGGLRVPFIVCGPQVKPNTHSDIPVTGLDLLPTIADLANYGGPLPAALDGGSLVPVFNDPAQGRVQRNQPFLVFHQAVNRKAQSALIFGRYKLVKTWRFGTVELFDLESDISEQRDLAKKIPGKRDQLHQMLVRFLDRIDAETTQTVKK